VPLLELPDRLQRGRRNRPVAAITFDDGYLDNLASAKPVLDRLNLPATIFVPVGWIGDPRPMWWDRLSQVLLGPNGLPESLTLRAHGQDFSWHQEALARQGPPGQRARAQVHRDVWTRLRQLPHDDARHEVVDALAVSLGADERPVADARPMTLQELHQLLSSGRFSLGSHSVTHPSLPSLPSEEKRREIEESASQFHALLGTRPSTFAYPYGDLDAECVALVRSAGYALACSTEEDLTWQGDDPHTLNRIAVGNWSAAEFKLRLTRYWLA